jgi:hypothetical protein
MRGFAAPARGKNDFGFRAKGIADDQIIDGGILEIRRQHAAFKVRIIFAKWIAFDKADAL